MRPLTYDEHKAAEAAFRGLPPDPTWTAAAQAIYRGLTTAKALRGRDKIGEIGNSLEPHEALEVATRG